MTASLEDLVNDRFLRDNAFLTGSRAYGTPRHDSDWDVVVLMGEDDARRLKEKYGPKRVAKKGADEVEADQYDDAAGALRIDSLNLLVFTNPAKFDVWRKVTEALRKIAPVTREHAVAAVKAAGGGGA